MFKEFFEGDEDEKEKTKYMITYFYIAMLEAIENSVALATFSLIEIDSALIGFILAGIVKKVPLRVTRLVAGILLTSTAIPLIIYGLGIASPEFLHLLVPPLS